MQNLDQNESSSKPISDGCPNWAEVLIQRIYLLELEAGSIKKLGDSAWSTTTEQDLLKIAGQLDGTLANRDDLNLEVESLFTKVARGLSSENFSSTQIAAFINARVPTGCKLPYCNQDEVESAC